MPEIIEQPDSDDPFSNMGPEVAERGYQNTAIRAQREYRRWMQWTTGIFVILGVAAWIFVTSFDVLDLTFLTASYWIFSIVALIHFLTVIRICHLDIREGSVEGEITATSPMGRPITEGRITWRYPRFRDGFMMWIVNPFSISLMLIYLIQMLGRSGIFASTAQHLNKVY